MPRPSRRLSLAALCAVFLAITFAGVAIAQSNEKLRSGDIFQVAEVVRNLSIREKDKGLSAGEKRMLAKARQILVSELTFAVDSTEEHAEAMLDKVLEEAR